MKALILSLLLLPRSLMAAPVDTVAIPRATLVEIQHKTDDLQKQLGQAQQERTAAEHLEADAQAKLKDATTAADALENQIEAKAIEEANIAKERDEWQAKDKADAASRDRWKRIVCFLGSGLALTVFLALRAPTWPLPYGIGVIVTVLSAPVTYFILMRF